MKKRILSLVLCAAMLLSMCLFLGAGIAEDTTADGTESTETVESVSSTPEFQSVGPFMTYFPSSAAVQLASVPSTAAANNDSSGAASSAGDALNVNKTAAATDKKDEAGNPIYRINLSAEAKSNIVTHTKACDIVLVLDRSGSMNYSLAGSDNDSKERVKALQTSVNAFLTTIQQNSPDSRVAIVTYASDATNDTNGFVSVSNSNKTGVNSALTTVVNGLSDRCSGGTQSGKGLQQAVSLFNAVSTTDANYDNTRVTVLFTDGKPGDNVWQYKVISNTGEGYDVAQQSIHWSHILKYEKGSTINMQSYVADQDFYSQRFDENILSANHNKYGVSNYQDFHKGSANQSDWNWTGCGSTVYCVGLGLTAYSGSESEGSKINEYMYRVSSHRPDGSHVNNNRYNSWEKDDFDWSYNYTDERTRNHSNGYYLTTSNADQLKDIFQQIAQQTGEAVKDVTIRDEISESFVPCDADGNVYPVGATIQAATGQTGTVQQDAATGNYYIEWENVTLAPEEVNSNKEVTKAAQTFSGTLYVKPRDGFLGGNNVPTNGTGSGVYTDGDEPIKLFPQPEVNVPIKATAAAVTKNIYYGNPAPSLADLTQTADLATWQTKYVTVTYLADKDISNTQDGTYNVTMTVTPVSTAEATSAGTAAVAKSTTVTSTVNVYKPEITFNDSRINYGDLPDYGTANGGSVVWKHNDTAAAAADMTGTAPTLTYTYSPEASAFTQDTYVNVTVLANGTALPKGVVAFVHDECDFPGCSFDSKNGQFIVHINVFDLTIVKTAKDGTTIDQNQTFVFKIMNKDTGKTLEVVITGAGEQVIKNLPMGSYTITEDTSWSWQYLPTKQSQDITVNATSATVTFENTKTGTNWLTSLAKAINTWVNGKADLKN